MHEQLEAVQRMQDYISEHLDEEITLADLARAAHYSPWYAHRIFFRYVNLNPADYIRRFRLAKSAIQLRDNPCPITNIAFQMGFKSVDGYQRAFYREFGCNPHEYVANPIPIYLFTPFSVKYRENMEVKKVTKTKSIFIQLIDKPARMVLIKRGIAAKDYFGYCEEVGCEIWGLLKSIRSISNEPVGLWLPSKYIKPNTSEYVQGVEVPLDYNGPIPQGLDALKLPAAKFLMFQGEPYPEEDYCLAIEELQEAVERYDPAVIGYRWDNDNPHIQLEPIGTRGYIELVPIIK